MWIEEQKGKMWIDVELNSVTVMQMRLGNKMNKEFRFGLVWLHGT